jgi:hypothetical protein
VETTSTLSGREGASRRAVVGGGAEPVLGAAPDLLLGGRYCCDQGAAHPTWSTWV